MKQKFDLVVMDWGIGGLSVYREIARLMPYLSILYYSDSGQKPYGKMSSPELRRHLLEIIDSFAALDIRHFVIACNAASTALPALEKKFSSRGIVVTGVIDRGVELVQNTSYKKVGIIGGRRTILSRIYTKRLHSKKRKTIGRIAQPLSALIERGELQTPLMRQTLQQILAPLRDCDSLLLACTHYPAVSGQIQNLLPDCKLLDPAFTTASYIKKNWKFRKRHGQKGQHSFVTSGNLLEMKRAALAAFNININKVIALKDFPRALGSID